MNFGQDQFENNGQNLIGLIKGQEEITKKVRASLIDEARDFEVDSESYSSVRVVNESSFPDQSIYLLEDQLSELKSRLERMRFYLRELEDILPS